MVKQPWQHDRRSRHARGYGSQWVRTRALVLKIDNYLCQPCLRQGRPTPATEVDHIVPKSQGGGDEADNLEAICKNCHVAKTKTEAEHGRGCKAQLGFDANGRAIWPD